MPLLADGPLAKGLTIYIAQAGYDLFSPGWPGKLTGGI
jgi:hypothetical protein